MSKRLPPKVRAELLQCLADVLSVEADLGLQGWIGETAVKYGADPLVAQAYIIGIMDSLLNRADRAEAYAKTKETA